MIVGERFWQTVDQRKLSTKLKHAVFGTLKKLFLKKADDERKLIPPLLERVELKQDGMRLQLKLAPGSVPAAIINNDLPMQIKRRGVEMRMIVGECKGKPDPNLLKAVARARMWFDELATGQVASVADIVGREEMDQGYVSRLLKLAFLSPWIVESMVAGTQPADWTVITLTTKNKLIVQPLANAHKPA